MTTPVPCIAVHHDIFIFHPLGAMLKGVVAAERVPEMCCWYQRSGRTDEIVPANARPGSAVIRQVLASSNCCLAARGRVLKQTYRLAILQPSQRDAMFLGHLGETNG